MGKIDKVRALLEAAQHPAAVAAMDPRVRPGDDEKAAGGDERKNLRAASAPPDPETVKACVQFDHSDTDNAHRLMAHFGDDILAVAQRGGKAPAFAVWTGAHWDIDGGAPRALALAQALGERIKLEAGAIAPSAAQDKELAAASAAMALPKDKRGDEDNAAIAAGRAIRAAIADRRSKRRQWGQTSKNHGRLVAMLACHAPHCQTPADEFNADKLRFATPGHTVAFAVKTVVSPNPAFVDPDVTSEEVPPTISATLATVTATPGHDRADRISQLVPTAYVAGAACPRWLAFLEEVQPEPAMRRLLAQSFGLGLIGVTVQRLFFHYGSGANGKSVALETVTRCLGGLAVTLPSESFFGPSRQGGSASPDIARLHGRRLLRVKELPEGEQLREAMVKELTGGEAITARTLFEGYFDFLPEFVAHLSGNAEPYVKDISEGFWRRIVVVPWPVTIAAERRRDFEEILAGFMAEAPGILNWLIDGARDFLEHGLQVPAAAVASTAEYRADMDPLHGFFATCIEVTKLATDRVQAADLYSLYRDWSAHAGVDPMNQTRFAKRLRRRADGLGMTREEGRHVHWIGIKVAWNPPHVATGGDPGPFGGDRS
jgi:putative DNA primase/helicase